MSRKTEIEIQFSETVAYISPAEKFEAFCVRCGSAVEMATPQLAAILRGVGERQIYRLIDSGSIHFVEADRIVICLQSLDLMLGIGNRHSGDEETGPV